MILLEYCHHPLPQIQHQDHLSYNVTSTIDVIKCIQQYIVQLKLINNPKNMMTTIILFVSIPLYIMILYSNSTSTTSVYPCILPGIISNVDSQDKYNNHSLIYPTFSGSSHNNPNSIQSSIDNKIIGPEDFNINIFVYTSGDLIKDSTVPIQKVQLKLFYFLIFEATTIVLFSINVMLFKLWLVCNRISDSIDI